jgi:hypothetical protein
MIPKHLVDIAVHIVDSSGAVDILLDGRSRSPRGRKTHPTPYRLLLIGGYLNVMTRGNFVIEDIHETLIHRLSLDDQFLLGVRRQDHGEVKVLSIHALYNVTKALDRFLAYGVGSAPDLEPAERERRRKVIQDFCDALMDVFDLGFSSHTYAIDATGIWSWGKGHHRRKKSQGGADQGGDCPNGEIADDGLTDSA